MSEPAILAWEWAWSQALWDSGRRFIGEGWPDQAEKDQQKRIVRRAITDSEDLARTKVVNDARWAEIIAETRALFNRLPETHAENVALDMVEAELQRLRENAAALLRALTNLHRLMLAMDLASEEGEMPTEELYAQCMAEAKAAIDKADGHAS